MDTMLTNTMDVVHENSISAIESLQTRFDHQRNMFFMISNVFDPRYAFLFYAPLIFSLNWKVGKQLMWVAIIAEWSNQILKWMLHGERPYWWIHETQVYNRTGLNTPDIQQYFLTCETGPGSPSGHSMVTAAVWYIIIEALLKSTDTLKNNGKNILHKACWSTYIVLLASVGLSRVYIAAHFPHQCVMGMAIGCLVAIAMNHINTDNLKSRHYLLATCVLLGSALSTFGILQVIGANPLWSLDRALKWCAKQEYIHLDTTPFFSMMRYCGFLLGMGLGLNSKNFTKLSPSQFTLGMKLTAAFLAVGMAKLSERIDLPKENMMLFYVLAFIMNAFLPYIMIAVIPNFVFRMYSRKLKNQ